MTDTHKTEAPVIVVRDLGKRYRIKSRRRNGDTERAPTVIDRITRGRGPNGWVWALRHVDLEVQRGEIFGIIGRNGSGKTTLLRVLAGVTRPTGGTAELRGRVAALLQVGAGFHPQLTGRDNIALSGAIIGLTPQEVARHFDEIVDFSEIGRYLDEPVKHYSSGMYARLAFSVAAFLPAEILLVDEVLAVGDAAFQQKAEARMRETLRDGRAVLYVGHDMKFIRSSCDHALVLDGGRMAYRGTAVDAADYYRDEIVRGGRTPTPPPRRESPR